MRRMPFAEYLKIDAINWSTLKHARRSPLHYRYAADHPPRDTTRLALGRAAHTAVFEPDRFLREYALFEGTRRAGKQWKAFQEQNAGKTILKVEEYETALAIRDAVRAHPVAAEYLRSGVAEQSISWTDALTGLPCKGRPDFISTCRTRPAIVDLKTTGDIEHHRFSHVVARMAYHAQGSFYQEGVAVTTGQTLPVVLIPVEATPPHDVAVYVVGEDELYAGTETVRDLLSVVAECSRTGIWPGRYPEEQQLRLPRYVFDEEGDTDISDEITIGASSENDTAQGG